MNRDSDTALRSRVGVGRFKATHHVEVKDDVQPADAKRYKGRETEMTQTTKANGLFTAFKVFEPSSRKFVKETTTEGYLQPAAILSLDIGEQDRLEEKFPQFQFLNLHGLKPDALASRTAARAHVMRHYHKEKDRRKTLMKRIFPKLKRKDFTEQRAEDPHSQSISCITSMVSPSSKPTRRYTQRWSTASAGYQEDYNLLPGDQQASDILALYRTSSPAQCHQLRELLPDIDIISRQSLSPLRSNLLAFPTQRREIELIHHYIQSFAKSALPMSSFDESQWFNKALTDEACFHATLFVSAAHRALLAGSGHNLPKYCYQHKGEAIRIINQRLRDPHQCIEDGTVAAIACLAAYENVNGSLTVAATHINGLECLGTLRGGFYSADMPGFLEQLVYWVELCNASALKKRARFTPPSLLNFMAPELVVPDSNAFAAVWSQHWGIQATETLSFQRYNGMGMTMATILNRISQLLLIRSKVQTIRELDTDTQQRFTTKVLLIERHINAAIHWPTAIGEIGFIPTLCMPFYSSALLFVYLVLRELPTTSSILDNFVTRLKTALSYLKVEKFWRESPHGFLLWVLFIGGWAAEGRSDRSWYSTQLAWLSMRMKVEMWEHAKSLLNEYAFMNCLCDRPCRELWDESRLMSFDSI